ncbi:MAG: hypothetical protein Q8P50_08745 [Bacillota bacterium]|nr:hypothetical protein [Bacillota bacterium]
MSVTTANHAQCRRTTLAMWAVTIATSYLPNVFFMVSGAEVPGWLRWAKIALLVAIPATAIVWQALRPLTRYSSVLAVFHLAEELSSRVGNSAFWRQEFREAGVGFAKGLMGVQVLKLAPALIVLVALLVSGFRRQDFFLVKGRVNAPAKPVSWLGMKGLEPWTRVGRVITLVVSLGTLTFMVIQALPHLRSALALVPLLPFVVFLRRPTPSARR